MKIKININYMTVLALIHAVLIVINFCMLVFVYIPEPIEEYGPLTWAGALFSLVYLVIGGACFAGLLIVSKE